MTLLTRMLSAAFNGGTTTPVDVGLPTMPAGAMPPFVVANWSGEDPLLDTDNFVPALIDVAQGSMRAIRQMLLR
jgi:hypothetical protein